MFLKALFAFLVLPGTVAFAVPLTVGLATATPRPGLASVTLLALGLAVLLTCVRDFYVAGKGTLAPWSPPRRLVRVGLYRVSRNPMYVGVVTILAGWALLFRSPWLAAYAALVSVVFHFRVLLHEEPWLARTFGGEWTRYSERVPRWIGVPKSS